MRHDIHRRDQRDNSASAGPAPVGSSSRWIDGVTIAALANLGLIGQLFATPAQADHDQDLTTTELETGVEPTATDVDFADPAGDESAAPAFDGGGDKEDQAPHDLADPLRAAIADAIGKEVGAVPHGAAPLAGWFADDSLRFLPDGEPTTSSPLMTPEGDASADTIHSDPDARALNRVAASEDGSPVYGTADDDLWIAFDVDSTFIDMFGGNDVLYGGRGDDVIRAGDGDDIVYSGGGNDDLDGGLGDDRYVFEGQAGDTQIVDQGGFDTLALSGDMSIENMSVDVDQADLILTFMSPTSENDDASQSTRIRLVNQCTDPAIERFVFNSDVIFSKLMVGQNGRIELSLADDGDHAVGTHHDDIIYGSVQDDRLDGGRGDDDIYGRGGDDVFVFRADAGHDVIHDFNMLANEMDVIEFSNAAFADYLALESVMRSHGDDVVITLHEHNSLTLKDKTLSSLDQDDFRFVA